MMLRRQFLIGVPGALLATTCASARGAKTRRPVGGEPLQIRGRLLSTKGAPLAGYTLDVYQTGDGYYARPDNDPRKAALRQSLVTDDDGRYRLTTIVPGHYPDSRNPMHIHAHLSGPGVPAHWIDSFLFKGDPYLRAADKKVAIALRWDRTADLWRGRRDLVLDPAVAETNRLVDGWYR
jgi:protocatechuate 3,4-dioxygenase beta subunit